MASGSRFNYTNRDEESLPPQDQSYLGFNDNYGFGDIMPEQGLPPADLEGRLSNVMLTYDSMPSTGASMPVSMDAGHSFAYCSYPDTTIGMPPQLDQAQLLPDFTPFSQGIQPQVGQYMLQPGAAGPPQRRNELYNDGNNSSGSNLDDSDFSRSSDRSQAQPHTSHRALQARQARPLQPSSSAPYRPLQPVAIQPKKPPAVKAEDPSPGLEKPASKKTEHTGIYSSSGFDVLGALGRVAMRPNPKINIGAVDLSCAFVMCDILREDHPIVYVSEAFERLTGYTKEEIVNRNCRFLQGPDGKVTAGAKRSFTDGQTVFRLRSTIEERTEIQASIINYRKGGQPFMNLITMIPIPWDSDEYRFYVGFQVDLVEKPDAVTRRNPDGTYSINYQRDQLPQYVVPPDVYRTQPDLVARFGHDDVTAILNAVSVAGPEASRQYLDWILVENTDDVIHVLSFNGEFLYLSPSCKRILEYDPVELIGKTLSTICHPSDIGPVSRDMRASTTTAPISIVYRVRQKHRGYMWFESHGAWHIDPNQGRKYLVMTGRPRPVYSLDQLARHGFSTALAENDIWAKVSLSGFILFVTSKAKPVLGRSPDDLIGKGLQELMESEDGPDAIKNALEAAARGQSGTNEPPPSFRHQMRHKKGHNLSAHTTLYAGDTALGTKPTFLVAQIRFARSLPSATEDENLTTVPGTDKITSLTTNNPNPPRQYGTLGQRMPDLSTLIGLNGLPTGNRSVSPSNEPAMFFTELNPRRGSSWQIELRELEKQNRGLADELQRLLNRRKKRKRKQSAISVEKACAICRTKNTPEWRRGPSGDRDLCNSCGLRWAKQNRSQQQQQQQQQGQASQGQAPAAAGSSSSEGR
ncbi:hypothetical protein N7474_005299 [Penicillium riverlandense]|uniref:uncharacterized protein n=1 Tax=Penicillium riverlandense TaxID=1903569 RepID=UPI002546D450|nr:uncharacterized protein N7474_005299 [Penicillium riverlandense]KAJ5819708.1 hypothetical protein N7474_005299 [Penicillium riverlandense]